MLIKQLGNSFLVGKLFWKLLEFEKALAAVHEGLTGNPIEAATQDWARLAIFKAKLLKELNRTSELDQWLCDLQSKKSNLYLISGLHFLAGRTAAEKGELEEAERLFEIAGAAAASKEDDLNAGYGRAMVYYIQGDRNETLKRLSQLKCADESEFPELFAGIYLSKARAFWELKNLDECGRSIQAAKNLAREDRNLYLHLQTLITESFLLVDQSEIVEAKRRWDEIIRLAPKSLGSTLKFRVEKLKNHLHLAGEIPTISLIKNPEKSVLSFKNKQIEMSQLPQLQKLLEKFAKEKGQVLTKEVLCEFIWGESYHPLRHDNKIYVTIRRLRVLLQNSFGLDTVILNRHEGYTFNPQIHFEQHSLGRIHPDNKPLQLGAQ